MRSFVRSAVIAVSVLSATTAFAGESKGFHLTIDGTDVDINPGDSLDVPLKDGHTVKVALQRNDTVSFSGDKFSFDHDGQYSVAKSDLGGGIVQYALITSIGTGVIVQEYKGMNPAPFTDLMLQQMVQEGVAAGAKIDKQPLEETLISGQVLKGVKAETTSSNDVMDYQVAAVGRPDGGIIVATFINKENVDKEGAIVDKLWSSLKTDY
ncbi:MAG: hypothetical protein KGI75_18575 [Rhizobiaceae bacterium]|nr:hypothetical protein [Rhizobiaceae bacterium]